MVNRHIVSWKFIELWKVLLNIFGNKGSDFVSMIAGYLWDAVEGCAMHPLLCQAHDGGDPSHGGLQVGGDPAWQVAGFWVFINKRK